jgi:hypothetical protein
MARAEAKIMEGAGRYLEPGEQVLGAIDGAIGGKRQQQNVQAPGAAART